MKARDAINAARALIGTPYAELDCIGLIKRVIRTAPGGHTAYTTAGTNTLWNSFTASAKYRDLTWRQEGVQGAMPGMLAFKRSVADVHHVGLVTERGTVIHSSSAQGRVVETALDGSWQLLGVHRYIGVDEKEEEHMPVLYKARVSTKDDPLNVRDSPSRTGRKIGWVERGALVDVLAEPKEGWLFVRLGDLAGYAASAYLTREEAESEEEARDEHFADTGKMPDASAEETGEEPYTTIRREDGVVILLAGRWTILCD